MAKVYIIDFEDSFTYNIYAELVGLGMNAVVYHHLEIKKILPAILNAEENVAIVLGPGPGHPSVYQKNWQPIVEKLLKAPHVFVMGICLGHQLLFMQEGLDVVHANAPAHGKIFQYSLSKQWQKYGLDEVISVQRYNSLAVVCHPLHAKKLTQKGYLLLCQDGELVMGSKRRFISYQFHPESVGTIYPHKFFAPILDFLL